MDVIHLQQGDPSYPLVLSQYLGVDTPSSAATLTRENVPGVFSDLCSSIRTVTLLVECKSMAP